MLRIVMDSVRKYVASRPESGGSKRQSKKNFVICYKKKTKVLVDEISFYQ